MNLEENFPEQALSKELLAFAESVNSRYEVKRQLGSGGMSKVLCAVDKQLHREVAIKIAHNSSFANNKAQDRFLGEMRALAQLKHSNIVRIFNTGISTEGLPYFVMELLEGEPLDEFAVKHRECLTVQTFLELMIGIASGLEQIHCNGLIHRDLKPSNIFVCNVDGRSITKIIDFGIVGFESYTNADNTNTKSALGTPNYMSPEQFRGSQVDKLSDIYSFGCIMYELLVGTAPLIGNTFAETMQMRLEQCAPALPCNNKLLAAKRISKLIQNCLEKLPQDRPKSAQWIKDSLEAIAKDSRCNNQLRTYELSIDRSTNRRKMFFIVSTLLAVICALGIGPQFIFKSSSSPGKVTEIVKSTENPDDSPTQYSEYGKLRRQILQGSLTRQLIVLNTHVGEIDFNDKRNFKRRELECFEICKELVARCKDQHKNREEFFAVMIMARLKSAIDNDYDGFIFYLKEVLPLTTANSYERVECLYDLAHVYVIQNELRKALPFLQQLNKFEKRANEQSSFIEPLWHPPGSIRFKYYLLMGDYNSRLGKSKISEAYFAKAQQIGLDSHDVLLLAYLANARVDSYKRRKNWDKAKTTIVDFVNSIQGFDSRNEKSTLSSYDLMSDQAVLLHLDTLKDFILEKREHFQKTFVHSDLQSWSRTKPD